MCTCGDLNPRPLYPNAKILTTRQFCTVDVLKLRLFFHRRYDFRRFMGVIYNTVQKKLGNIAQYHTRETTIFISPPPHYIEREIRATKYAENYFIINYIILYVTSFSLHTHWFESGLPHIDSNTQKGY